MLTPNMGLTESAPLVTLGPAWASAIEANFLLIDSHDHSAGKGIPIGPAGIYINQDFLFNHFNATQLRSSRFDSQSAALALAADINMTYVVNGELYYNDASGTPVQITAGGSVNVSGVGGISGLSGTTAAVTYDNINKVFVFTQDSGISAGLDSGPLTIRENVASAHGVTLQSPTSLAGDYALTLLAALPVSTLPLLVSSAGVMSTGQILTAQLTDLNVTTAKLAASAVTTAKIAASNVTTATIADGAVTPIKLSFANYVLSSSCGLYSFTGNTTAQSVTNLDATITVSGHRPIGVYLIWDQNGSLNPALISAHANAGPLNPEVLLQFQDRVNGGSFAPIALHRLYNTNANPNTIAMDIIVPPSIFSTKIPLPTAGTHEIKMLVKLPNAALSTFVEYVQLLLVEE